MRLDINYRRKKKTAKKTQMWRLSDTFLNNEEVSEEIRREIKKFLEINDTKTRQPKIYGMQQISSMRKVYSHTILPQETHQIDNLTQQLTLLEKGEQQQQQ